MRHGGILSKGRVLAALMAASVALSLLGPVGGEPLRGLARLVIAFPGDGGMYASTAVAHHVETAMRETISQDEAHRLRAENDYLHNASAGMAEELARTLRDVARIQHIRKHLYGRTREMPTELIPSRVVAQDSLPYTATRVVSAQGADDGALVTTRELWTGRRVALPGHIEEAKRLAVVTASALVGRITESDSYTAKLQLITDRSFRIGVQVHRVVRDRDNPRRITVETDGGPIRVERLTRYHPNVLGEARGAGLGGMEIPHVHKGREVRPGDVVLTRSDDAAVGAPIPVGRVERVTDDHKEPALFVTLHVKPYANLSSLREVYVIVPPKRPGAKGDGR